MQRNFCEHYFTSIFLNFTATVASENVDLSNIDGLLRTILVQLRPEVLNAVNNAMAQSTVAGNINADSLTDRIIREITTFVRLALEEEVLKATSNLENEVVEQVGYQSNVQIDFIHSMLCTYNNKNEKY